jgi:hypothetical protein
MPSAGVGRKPLVNVGAVPVCRWNWMAVSDAVAKTARTVAPAVVPTLKFTGSGVERLIWRLIRARSVVALWVLNRLAATIFLSPMRRLCIASRSSRR